MSTTPHTHTIVIGAGQAGLAMSRYLTDAAVDHVLLERGQTAERWRSVIWDSLRLLTPNWATRLPHWSYQGPAPDGYMSAVSVTHVLRAKFETGWRFSSLSAFASSLVPAGLPSGVAKRPISA